MTERALYCPACGRRYLVDPERLADRNLAVLCGSCETLFSPALDEAPMVHSSAVQEDASTVLIAHESPAVCRSVGRVVQEAGFGTRFAYDGRAAIAAFDDSLPDIPHAIVLDVAIPGVFSFDVVTSLRHRERSQPIPIVLLASVFDPTQYKRRPSSLYGADAYLELHHVPDRLPTILRARIAGDPIPPMHHRGHLPQEHAQAEAIRLGSSLEASAKSAAIARRVVSDIALYNEGELIEGIAAGDVEERLAGVFTEGRRIYREATQGLGPIEGDPFTQAIAELLSALQQKDAS